MTELIEIIDQSIVIEVVQDGVLTEIVNAITAIEIIDAGQVITITGGGGTATRIDQSSPSASWVLSHALGRVPIVDVFLPSGEMVEADVVASSTQISITFATAQTGFVIII